MIPPYATGEAVPENLHPLAQGSRAVPTNRNNGFQRLPCNAPVACKEPHCGLVPLTPCIRRRQIPASARARR